jgi:hypothetical protein
MQASVAAANGVSATKRSRRERGASQGVNAITGSPTSQISFESSARKNSRAAPVHAAARRAPRASSASPRRQTRSDETPNSAASGSERPLIQT